jgi:hypothetical protein
MGTLKMDRRDRELLDKQMRRLTPPRNDGVIAVMLAAMFLVGMTLGGVLSAHQTEPIQIGIDGLRGLCPQCSNRTAGPTTAAIELRQTVEAQGGGRNFPGPLVAAHNARSL